MTVKAAHLVNLITMASPEGADQNFNIMKGETAEVYNITFEIIPSQKNQTCIWQGTQI